MEAFFLGIRQSAGNSYVFETEVPLFFNQTFDPHFTIDLHCKDLVLGKFISDQAGVQTELFDKSKELYERTMENKGGEVGSSSPARLQEDQTGHKFTHQGYHDWTYEVIHMPGGGMSVKHTRKQK